eukprot:11210790-Lingulodinium_polyedra.AAC.1
MQIRGLAEHARRGGIVRGVESNNAAQSSPIAREGRPSSLRRRAPLEEVLRPSLSSATQRARAE